MLEKLNTSVDGIESDAEAMKSSLAQLVANSNLQASDIDKILDYLKDIESDTSDLETGLTTLNGTASNILAELNLIRFRLLDIESELDLATDFLGSIDTELGIQTGVLNSIDGHLYEIRSMLNSLLESQGVEDTSPLDNSFMDEMDMYDAGNITDDTDKLDSLTFNFGNGFTVVWNLVSEAWQANAKVFTVVIMCLTVGVLKLIFNR